MVATPGNALNITSSGLVKFDGTSAFAAVTTTQHDLLIGAASNGITSVAPSATSGVPVISQGASADPTFGTAVVAGGGTGVASFTDTNSLLCSGTTTTGALQDVASVASGQVLTSAGTSTLPSWSATPTLTSINLGDTALSKYKQGSFTPVLTFGGGSTGITYSFQIGEYTQIGNVVFFNLSFLLTNKGSSTGNAAITGLPVAAVNTSNFSYTCFAIAQSVTDASHTTVFAQINPGTTAMDLNVNNIAGGNTDHLTNTMFVNTSSVAVQGLYFTS